MPWRSAAPPTLAAAEQPAEAERLRALRDELASRLREAVPDLVVNAEGAERAPHVLNVAVAGADSEALLMHLDLAGVAASSGSACSTGAVEPSHVLVAMGVPRELALGAIRFSLGHESGPGGRRARGRGDAGRGGQGPEARGSARACLSACWWRCRAAWTARWPPRAWSSRATTWSAPR